jgi:hypothetical protein
VIPLRSIEEEKRNGASASDLSRWCGSGIDASLSFLS